MIVVQDVRDVARQTIGDTGLLDFVLKMLSNKLVGKYLVLREFNTETKVLEYCLEELPLSDPRRQETPVCRSYKCAIRPILGQARRCVRVGFFFGFGFCRIFGFRIFAFSDFGFVRLIHWRNERAEQVRESAERGCAR